MASSWPPALLPAGALLAAALLAPRLAVAPPTPLLLLLVALSAALRGRASVPVAALALGLLRAESSWIAPLRRSPGWDLERPVTALFEPDEAWEPRQDDWTTRGRILALEQDGRREGLALVVRAVVASRAPLEAAAVYRLRGHLRAPLAFHNGETTWTGGWQLRVKSARFAEAREPPRARGWPAAARVRLVSALGRERARGPGAVLLEGLLLGRTAALPDDWQRGLRRTGLMHLFAVSGLHVSLIAGLVWAAAAGAATATRASCAVGVATAYALLVGLQPSVARSMLMLTAVFGARLLQRPPSSLNALALAAGGLVAATPALVYDLGFQLTVAATAGVLGLGPWLQRQWGSGPVASALAACAGAQLATLPILVPVFSLVPIGGAALNLVGVPWSGLCLVLGLGWAVVALIDPTRGAALVSWFDPLGQPFGWLAGLPAHPLVSTPVALGAAASSVVAAALLWLVARPRRLALLLPAAALLWGGSGGDRDLEATLLDVGQGDALLLRDGRRALLVDGGGWPAGDFGGRVLVPALARLGVRRLDAVVVSHPDSDHCAGLADVAAYIPVEEVWIAPGWGDEPCLKRLLAGTHRRLRVLWRGDHLAWRRFAIVTLHPAPGEQGAGNDRSLVLEVSGGGKSLLLTGDISERQEAALVRRRTLRPVDALKVAHHGSASSSSRPFLASATPRWALLSAGRANAYGHPSNAALHRLSSRGVVVLRTDRHGRVRLRWRPDGPLLVATSRTPLLDGVPPPRVRLGPARLVFDELAAP